MSKGCNYPQLITAWDPTRTLFLQFHMVMYCCGYYDEGEGLRCAIKYNELHPRSMKLN